MRERMSVTLYGSYYPPAELRLLERQRDYLTNKGYARAGLVKDSDGDVGSLTASKRYLENSDVNFLIFTRNGRRHGLVRELAYIADAMSKGKVVDCVAFDQVVGGQNSVPDLSMCDLGNSSINRFEFHDESELCEMLLMRADLYLAHKSEILAKRLST